MSKILSDIENPQSSEYEKMEVDDAEPILSQVESEKNETGTEKLEDKVDVYIDDDENKAIEIKIEESTERDSIINEESFKRLKVNDQTTEKEYKPSIRLQRNVNALSESPSTIEAKKRIKVFENKHHAIETKEENIELENQRKIARVKERNYHGHSSDSQMQNIIYNWHNETKETKKENSSIAKQLAHSSSFDNNSFDNVNLAKRNKSAYTSSIKFDKMHESAETQLDIDERFKHRRQSFYNQKDNRIDSIKFDEIIRPYATTITDLFDEPIYSNLLTYKLVEMVRFNLNSVDEFIEKTNQNYDEDDSNGSNNFLEDLIDEAECIVENEAPANSNDLSIYSYNYVDIDEILDRILFKPIQLQSELVNKCLINHFLFDLNLEDHLGALRKYLLFENGEFAQVFVDQIAEFLFSIDFLNNKPTRASHGGLNSDLKNLLSPIYVNEALNKAVSQVKNCKYIENISIRINSHASKSVNSTELSTS